MTATGTGTARTEAANRARQHSTHDKLQRVETTLRTMRRERTPITYPTVAARVGVSRTFLYQNTDAKKLVATAIEATGDRKRRDRATHDANIEASWHQRALNAEDAIKRPTPRSTPSASESASCSASSAIFKLNTLKVRPNASLKRTVGSNSASDNSPRTTAASSKGWRRRVPITFFWTSALRILKPNYLIPDLRLGGYLPHREFEGVYPAPYKT